MNTDFSSVTKDMPLRARLYSGAVVACAVEQHLAGDQRQLARERQQRRRLAGAVGAEQADDLARVDLEVDVVDDRLAGVAGGHAPVTDDHRGPSSVSLLSETAGGGSATSGAPPSSSSSPR